MLGYVALPDNKKGDTNHCSCEQYFPQHGRSDHVNMSPDSSSESGGLPSQSASPTVVATHWARRVNKLLAAEVYFSRMDKSAGF
jgi:hypothetical protein